jgi:hypothetical protein
LNLVERWFKEITDKRIRRASFGSVDELVAAVDHWAEHWNDDPKPLCLAPSRGGDHRQGNAADAPLLIASPSPRRTTTDH